MALEPAVIIPVDLLDLGVEVAGGAVGIRTVIFHFQDVAGLDFIQRLGAVFDQNEHGGGGGVPDFELVQKIDIIERKFDTVKLVHVD
jgi:hypothetical protein